MVATSAGAVVVVVPPLALLTLGAADVWAVEAALRASSFALVLSLVVIAFLAVRSASLPPGKKALVLLAEFLLGLLVIGLEFAANG